MILCLPTFALLRVPTVFLSEGAKNLLKGLLLIYLKNLSKGAKKLEKGLLFILRIFFL